MVVYRYLLWLTTCSGLRIVCAHLGRVANMTPPVQCHGLVCTVSLDENSGASLLQSGTSASRHEQAVHSMLQGNGDIKHMDKASIDDCGSESSIRPFLEHELKGKHFTFVVNPGNSGDALIHYGTLLLFDDLGLSYDIASSKSTHRNKTLVYSGAGNLVGIYVVCAQFLAANAPLEKGNYIVLLPATIRNEDHLLHNLRSNVKIFTRERMSYEYVKAVASDASVCLSKDMAFYIEELDSSLPTLRERARNADSPRALMLRTDEEGFGAYTIPEGNRDLSNEGYIDYSSEAQYRSDVKSLTQQVMEGVSNYKEVWTNRLHLCIASSLVGVEVHCMDNNYGKVKAVFDFSLKSAYPNAHWDGEIAKRPWQESVTSDGLALVTRLVAGGMYALTNDSKASSPLDSNRFPSEMQAFYATSQFMTICVAAGGFVMLVFHSLEQFTGSTMVANAAFMTDVLVWYGGTAVYLAISKDLVASSYGPALGIIAFIQVFAGAVLLPLGEPRKLLKLPARFTIVFASIGVAFYFGTLFNLVGLSRSSIPFVSNLRALEPLSTSGLMVLFGGEKLSRLQYIAIFVAVSGVILTSNHPMMFVDRLKDAERTNVLQIVLLLLMSNLLFSLRNVILHEASRLCSIVHAQVTFFAVSCLMALPPAGIMFAAMRMLGEGWASNSHLFADPLPLVGSSVTFVLYNLASFRVLIRVRPTTHAMLLTLKRVATVLLACMLLHQLPSVTQTVGLLITAFGVVSFETDRRRHKMLLAEAEKSDEREASVSRQESSNVKDTHMINQCLESSKDIATLTSALVVACLCVALRLCV